MEGGLFIFFPGGPQVQRYATARMTVYQKETIFSTPYRFSISLAFTHKNSVTSIVYGKVL